MSVNHLDIQYMFQNNWTEDYVELYDATKRMEKEPYFTAVDDAVILPTKSTKGFSWGLGGVLDCDGEFVEESAVGYNAFGGGIHILKTGKKFFMRRLFLLGSSRNIGATF